MLRAELGTVTWAELARDIRGTPFPRLAAALTLTVLNYAALILYDILAFAAIGKSLPLAQVAAASFMAFALANNIGLAMVTGASVSYRFYSRWGVTAEELARIIVLYTVTFWLGLFALGGLSLIVGPLPIARRLSIGPPLLIAIGLVLLLVPPIYLAATLVGRRPIRFGRFEIPLPRFSIAAGQLVISSIDWALAGAVLYTLLPPSELTFLRFLGAFLASMLLGMASHVPGGLGVFEGLMVLTLAPDLSPGQVLPTLVVYRAVYYLLPLTLALVGLVTDEVWQRRAHVVRAGAVLGRVTEQLTPRVSESSRFSPAPSSFSPGPLLPRPTGWRSWTASFRSA